jgi:hypothetical protein
MLNFWQTSWKRVVKTRIDKHRVGRVAKKNGCRVRIPKISFAGSSQLFSAQAEMLLRIPSWRAQWQYWSSSVQLTEAMAGGSQVFCFVSPDDDQQRTRYFHPISIRLKKDKDREREKNVRRKVGLRLPVVPIERRREGACRWSLP